MRKIVTPSMPKIRPIQFRKKIKVPGRSKKSLIKEWRIILTEPSLQPKAVKLYETIFRIIAIIREIKTSVYDLNYDDDTVQSRKAALLDVLPKILELFIRENKEFNKRLGMDFLAFARKKCERRLKLLESLKKEPDLVTEFDQTTSSLERMILEEEQSLAYFHSIRAKDKKLAKIFCFYPILTILRLDGEEPIERRRHIRQLLIKLDAPDFGESYEDGKFGIGEKEELKRIREWDRESIKWFKSL